MTIVIDASIALSWCFDDEKTPETDALGRRVAKSGALVPSLWPIEVGNALLHAERRGRLTSEQVRHRLNLIGSLPIEVDGDTIARLESGTIPLARQYALTVYDATYLELAIRRGVRFATKDKQLVQAATVAGVTTEP